MPEHKMLIFSPRDYYVCPKINNEENYNNNKKVSKLTFLRKQHAMIIIILRLVVQWKFSAHLPLLDYSV